MFIATTLGVTTGVYFKYAIFNLTMPFATILLAALGIAVTKMTPEEQKLADEGKLV